MVPGAMRAAPAAVGAEPGRRKPSGVPVCRGVRADPSAAVPQRRGLPDGAGGSGGWGRGSGVSAGAAARSGAPTWARGPWAALRWRGENENTRPALPRASAAGLPPAIFSSY